MTVRGQGGWVDLDRSIHSKHSRRTWNSGEHWRIGTTLVQSPRKRSSWLLRFLNFSAKSKALIPGGGCILGNSQTQDTTVPPILWGGVKFRSLLAGGCAHIPRTANGEKIQLQINPGNTQLVHCPRAVILAGRLKPPTYKTGVQGAAVCTALRRGRHKAHRRANPTDAPVEPSDDRAVANPPPNDMSIRTRKK